MATAFTKTIEMTLDDSSIEKAINEIEKFIENLNRGLQALTERLLDEGVMHAKMQITAMPAVDTGALLASIGHGAYDPQSHTGVIYAGAYYAVFVEFGTGIAGKSNPHPGIKSGDMEDFAVLGSNGTVYTGYDTNKHGEEGWIYKKVGDNGFSWTKGVPSRPFMYNTYITLQDLAERYGGETIATYVY